MDKIFLVVVLLASVVFTFPVENGFDDEYRMQKALESAGLYQGDIALTDEQKEMLKTKTGWISSNYHWPGAVVPYEIVSGHFGKSNKCKNT